MKKVEISEVSLPGLEGNPDLTARLWQPEESARAWIILLHGQNDHSGRYSHAGQAFAEAGFAFLIPDFRGHGKSPGKRGHVLRFSEYIRDGEAAVRYAESQQPRRLILGGHSLGGFVAACIAEEMPQEFAGVFVSSPFLRLNFALPGFQMFLVRIISRILPGLALDNHVKDEDLSHDPDMIQQKKEDPDNFGTISARAFVEILDNQGNCIQQAEKYKNPLLVLHGSSDQVTDPKASEEFYNNAGSRNKDFRLYDGFFHELLNETDRNQVINDIIAWCQSLTE